MKFRPLLAGLAAICCAVGALAQTAPAADTGFSADAFRAHVAYLADDRLEGRETGSRGHDIAARYVADQFAALGLTPGAGGSWFQPIEFARFGVPGAPTIRVGGHLFTHARGMVMRASPETAALDLDAAMVFAGFGLDLPGQGFDDYRGIDARGKVVVVIEGIPAGVPSDVASHLASEKRRMAARRGAVGMITIRTRVGAAQIPWERVLRYAGRPGTTWIGPDGRPHDDADGLRFGATLDSGPAETLFQGSRRRLGQVLDEAGRPGARPRGFPLVRRVHVRRDAATLTRFSSPNVVAVLPGSDPAVVNEFVLLVAHLDHLGKREARPGEPPETDRINNGAMDNASGVATLIEVARAMSRPGNRPRRPVLIAAVTGEELGLLGAGYLAHNPPVAGRIVAVVNLDMPILTYDFQDVTAFGAEHSTLGPIVERAAARMGVRVAPDPLPEEGLFTRSDHYRFVQLGIPSVFLMTGFAGDGRREFRRFLDTRYHSPSDDLTQSFNWQAGARFARLNYLIAREIADAPEVPLWYAGDFFADAVGAGQRVAPRP